MPGCKTCKTTEEILLLSEYLPNDLQATVSLSQTAAFSSHGVYGEDGDNENSPTGSTARVLPAAAAHVSSGLDNATAIGALGTVGVNPIDLVGPDVVATRKAPGGKTPPLDGSFSPGDGPFSWQSAQKGAYHDEAEKLHAATYSPLLCIDSELREPPERRCAAWAQSWSPDGSFAPPTQRRLANAW